MVHYVWALHSYASVHSLCHTFSDDAYLVLPNNKKKEDEVHAMSNLSEQIANLYTTQTARFLYIQTRNCGYGMVLILRVQFNFSASRIHVQKNKLENKKKMHSNVYAQAGYPCVMVHDESHQ